MDNWQQMDTATLEQHFNPRIAVPDAPDHLQRLAGLASAARARMDMRRNISYGAHPREVYDLISGPFGGPLHIFIHGGYWRALSKDEHHFVAEPLAGAGATVVMLNYPLCPDVTLSQLVAAVIRGVAHAIRNAGEYGADAARVHVSGHSAGAHLAAMVAAHDWPAEGLENNVIRSATLLSGIFDPRPTLQVSVNEEIGLTMAEAEANNALNHPPRPDCDVLVGVGGDEPPGWQRQSADYRDTNNITRPLMQVAGTNHFTLLDEMTDPHSELVTTMTGMMGL